MYFSTICSNVPCDIFVVNLSKCLLVTLCFCFHEEKNTIVLDLYTLELFMCADKIILAINGSLHSFVM
jgi:hypothetical protein